MTGQNDGQKQTDGFFVKLPLGAIQIMGEVKGAFPLLWWYVGRTTIEYAAGNGIRVGGVLRLTPLSDSDVAADLRKLGFQSSADQIYRHRQTLQQHGYVTWLRTPKGQRTLVVNSEKYGNDPTEPVPKWAVPLVREAINKRLSYSAKSAEPDSAEIKAPAAEIAVPSAIFTAPAAKSAETIKKDKLIENMKGHMKYPPTPQGGLPTDFDAFWKAYPRKAGKGAALKAWLKVKPSADLQQKIFAAIEAQKKTRDWSKDGGQYIPHPATWLNQMRWEDEPPDALPPIAVYEPRPRLY